MHGFKNDFEKEDIYTKQQVDNKIPTQYLKDASVDDGVLTLIRKNDTTIVFEAPTYFSVVNGKVNITYET